MKWKECKHLINEDYKRLVHRRGRLSENYSVANILNI